jgi:hypothetical protein
METTSEKRTIDQIIEGGGYGLPESVVKLFSVIVKKYPFLGVVEFGFICPEEMKHAVGFYDFVTNADGEVVPIIYLNARDKQSILDLMRARPKAIAMNEQMLGIKSGSMTTALLQIFIVLHELGHAKDFLENYQGKPELEGKSPEEVMEWQRKQVLATLPVKNTSPSKLVRSMEECETFEEIVAKHPEIKEHACANKIVDQESLLMVQEDAYRNAAPEKYADEFASQILKEHAEELGVQDILINS